VQQREGEREARGRDRERGEIVHALDGTTGRLKRA
jgi:hypothetical protein